jgi:molybdate transport system substrate-binding protein
MSELVPAFEKATGHRINVAYGAASILDERIRKGEAVDVAVLLTSQVNVMAEECIIVSGSQRPIARVGFGVAAGPGVTRTDVGTVEAFNPTLLATRTVAVSDPALGGFGGYLLKLFQQLGIEKEMKARTIFGAQGRSLHQVADGTAQIGFAPISEIVEKTDVTFLGALPTDIASYNNFSVAVMAKSANIDAALAFINFMTTPEAALLMKSKGLEPQHQM